MKRVSRLTLALLVVLALTGLLLQAASLPHLHQGNGAGLYNEEHDLTLLAGLAGHVIPVEAVAAIAYALLATFLVLSVRERPALHLGRSGDSRAPPVR